MVPRVGWATVQTVFSVEVPWKQRGLGGGRAQTKAASEEVSELLWAGVPGLKKSTTNPIQGQEAGLRHSSFT